MAPQVALTLAVLVLWTAAPSGAEPSAESVRDCLEANFPERSSLQHLAFHSVDRAGGTRDLVAWLHWKRFDDNVRAMMRVESPNALKDAAYLMIQPVDKVERVYVYMPAMKKVQRITAKTALNRLWGTDFSYEDMKFMQTALEDVRVVLRGSGEVSGRPTHILETHLETDAGSPYQRVVSHVDTESCVALRTEFYERGDRPRKVLDIDPGSLIRNGERWIGTRYEMFDAFNETRTTLTVERSEIDPELPDRLFNPRRLGKEVAVR